MIDDDRIAVYYLTANIFRDYKLTMQRYHTYKLQVLHEDIDTGSNIALIFVIIEILVYIMALSMVNVLFSKLYGLFYDLVEVLLFFDAVDIHMLRQNNKSFLELIEKTSTGSLSIQKGSANEIQSQQYKEPNSKEIPIEEQRSHRHLHHGSDQKQAVGKQNSINRYLTVNEPAKVQTPVKRSEEVIDSQRVNLISNRSNFSQMNWGSSQRNSELMLETAREDHKDIRHVYLHKLKPVEESSIQEIELELPALAPRNKNEGFTALADLNYNKIPKYKTGTHSRISRGVIEQVKELDENEDDFNSVNREAYEAMEITDRIVEYRKMSKRGKMTSVAKLMLITIFLIGLGLLEFYFALSNQRFFRKVTAVLYDLEKMQTSVAYTFSSAYMAVSTLKSTWVYKSSLCFNG